MQKIFQIPFFTMVVLIEQKRERETKKGFRPLERKPHFIPLKACSGFVSRYRIFFMNFYLFTVEFAEGLGVTKSGRILISP